MMSDNFSKMYVIETKSVSHLTVPKGGKTRGENMKDSLAMLMKTNGGKMSVLSSLAMLMKTQDLHAVSRDIDENK